MSVTGNILFSIQRILIDYVILILLNIFRSYRVDKDLEQQLEIINLRLQQIETNQKILLEKLSKHIDFIDDTYEGLKNPINAAKRFLGR